MSLPSTRPNTPLGWLVDMAYHSLPELFFSETFLPTPLILWLKSFHWAFPPFFCCKGVKLHSTIFVTRIVLGTARCCWFCFSSVRISTSMSGCQISKNTCVQCHKAPFETPSIGQDVFFPRLLSIKNILLGYFFKIIMEKNCKNVNELSNYSLHWVWNWTINQRRYNVMVFAIIHTRHYKKEMLNFWAGSLNSHQTAACVATLARPPLQRAELYVLVTTWHTSSPFWYRFKKETRRKLSVYFLTCKLYIWAFWLQQHSEPHQLHVQKEQLLQCSLPIHSFTLVPDMNNRYMQTVLMMEEPGFQWCTSAASFRWCC